MKKFLMALCVSLALVTMIAPAYALELWEPRLPGIGEGLAAGALPPPGFYFIDFNYFPASYKVFDGEGNVGAKLNGYVNVPVLLWSTGCCFLGADYGIALAEPFDFTNLRLGSDGQLGSGDQWGSYNTVLVPIILSWKIPCDFRVKFDFSVGVPDAWTSPGDSIPGTKLVSKNDGLVYAWSGLNNWFFIPDIGISWLHKGWNISADIAYSIQTKDNNNDYQSGDMLQIDWTASYTCGKWTVGAGATTNWQTTRDTDSAFPGLIGPDGNQERKIFVGPLVGYNFGPCSLMLIYNFNVETRNAPGGDTWMFRFVVPLGNPYPIGGR